MTEFAGTLAERVTIERLEDGVDDLGGPAGPWIEEAVTWAAVVPDGVAALAAADARSAWQRYRVSYELFDAHCPAAWKQRAADGSPALTGWVPPSTLLSPVNADAMAYLQAVARAFVELAVAAGQAVRFQIGEPWWWVRADGRICLYDDAARAAFGGSPPVIANVRAALSAAEKALLDQAGALLAASTAGLRDVVRAEAAGAEVLLLVYLPIQFGIAEAVSPTRCRLRRLLRGRRGTEAAIGAHVAGERFVLLDPAVLTPFDPPPEWLGASLSLRAAGPGDPPTSLPAVTVALQGHALLPIPPVHLRASRLADGAIRVAWTRRSRQGWGWISGSDAPLAEQDERYRLRIVPSGGTPRSANPALPQYDYAAADQIADCGALATTVTVEVAQLSAIAGPGAAAQKSLFIPLI